MVVDTRRLNEARWAACNTRYGGVPSMEWCGELADRIVAAYLGLALEELIEQTGEPYDSTHAN